MHRSKNLLFRSPGCHSGGMDPLVLGLPARAFFLLEASRFFVEAHQQNLYSWASGLPSRLLVVDGGGDGGGGGALEFTRRK